MRDKRGSGRAFRRGSCRLFWSRFAAFSWSSTIRAPSATLMLGAATSPFGPFVFRLQLQHLLKPVIRGLNRRRVVWMPCQPAASGGLVGPQTSPQGPICPHLAMKRRPAIVPTGNHVASGVRSSAIRLETALPLSALGADANQAWEVSATGLAKPPSN